MGKCHLENSDEQIDACLIRFNEKGIGEEETARPCRLPLRYDQHKSDASSDFVTRSVLNYDCLSSRYARRLSALSPVHFLPAFFRARIIPTSLSRYNRIYTGSSNRCSTAAINRHNEGVAKVARPWTETHRRTKILVVACKFFFLSFYQYIVLCRSR